MTEQMTREALPAAPIEFTADYGIVRFEVSAVMPSGDKPFGEADVTVVRQDGENAMPITSGSDERAVFEQSIGDALATEYLSGAYLIDTGWTVPVVLPDRSASYDIEKFVPEHAEEEKDMLDMIRAIVPYDVAPDSPFNAFRLTNCQTGRCIQTFCVTVAEADRAQIGELGIYSEAMDDWDEDYDEEGEQ